MIHDSGCKPFTLAAIAEIVVDAFRAQRVVTSAMPTGSVALNSSDAWSDVDLHVCFGSRANPSDCRDACFTALESVPGRHPYVIDASFVAPDSLIAFYGGVTRVHVSATRSQSSLRGFAMARRRRRLSIASASLRPAWPHAARERDADGEMLFWLIKLIVSIARREPLAEVEARLHIADVVLLRKAAVAGADFAGFKRTSSYVDDNEVRSLRRYVVRESTAAAATISDTLRLVDQFFGGGATERSGVARAIAAEVLARGRELVSSADNVR